VAEEAHAHQPLQRTPHPAEAGPRSLDRAVLAACAAVDPAGGWQEDWAAVWTDTGAGQPLPTEHPLRAQRAEIDRKVLRNLLRMNHERAR